MTSTVCRSSSAFRQPASGWLLGLVAIAVSATAAPAAAREFDFNQDIRPLLSDKCFQCHGPDSAHRAADLRLDIEESAKEDLGGYRAIDVDAPDESEVLARIDSDDADLVMPPPEIHKELTEDEKRLLREWIEAGANWSLAWAYVEPRRSPPPEVSESVRLANWVDHFVLDRLEREQLQPAGPADPVTLIRRLHFDLTGLPPTADVVEAYAADPTPEAYEEIVDELLASPRFGERMATYWLDLVRFADTVGYHGDQDQNIWPYRDYVIHAFNNNKPFDEFTTEQLAGDLLPDATLDDRIASAYNRLQQTSHEGGVQLKEYRAIYMADRVRNVSQVWMGATLGCAQCHDHKFDPLSSEEFYALGAFFADIDDEAHLRSPYNGYNKLPTRREPQIKVRSVYQRQRLERLDAVLAEMDALDKDQDADAIAALRNLRAKMAEPSWLMVSKSSEPRTVRVQARGDWQDESGEVVTPQGPAALGWERVEEGKRASRLDLARWLTDADGGSGKLTARVMANRFWYLMFGEGLAVVLDDFGGQGQPPTHPELLDNLAIEFVDSGWDVKHMIKLLVLSQTYRQSSQASDEVVQIDPMNKLLARQARFRLPAEMVRDTALKTAGLLDGEIGGPSAKPYQPIGYYANLNFPKRTYKQHDDRRQWRRGLYMHWQRQYLHPMLKAFDAPTREECTARRPRSNTPLSSLTLLNDPTFVEAARSLAAEVLSQTSDQASARIEALYRRAVSRAPDEFELAQVEALVASQTDYYSNNPEAAEALLSVGLSPSPRGVDQAELAAWTFAARTVLNLSETLTRN